MLWAHAYRRFYLHVLLPAGQQSFTPQIPPGALRNRTTHFSLTSPTGVIHGSYLLPLSFPSAQGLGSMELWTAPWVSVGWFYRLFCLKQKHLAVPLLRDWLSPAQAGLSLWVLLGSSSGGGSACFLFEVAQTYWALHCRWHHLMGFAVRFEFMRGWKKGFSSPAGFQDPSETMPDCCQDWFCCNINDLSGQLGFHKHVFLIIQIRIAKV